MKDFQNYLSHRLLELLNLMALRLTPYALRLPL